MHRVEIGARRFFIDDGDAAGAFRTELLNAVECRGIVGAVDGRVGEHGLASWTESGGFGSQPFLARLSGGESRKVIDARLLRTARVCNELLKLGFPVNPPKTKRQIAGPGLPGDHMLAIAVMVPFCRGRLA